MKISEIVKTEQENIQIVLHKEGLFYRVYERSAFLFVKHIKEYQVIKKYYKNVKQEVAYLGFPQHVFSKIELVCKEQDLQNFALRKNKNSIVERQRQFII